MSLPQMDDQTKMLAWKAASNERDIVVKSLMLDMNRRGILGEFARMHPATIKRILTVSGYSTLSGYIDQPVAFE